MPEKSIQKNQQFYSERETSPHFAQNGSFEQEISLKWIAFYELENQMKKETAKKIEQAREIGDFVFKC